MKQAHGKLLRRLATWLVLAVAWPAAAAEAPRPNIVFIIADDLGYGDLSCYGQKHFQTPVLDGLAAEGLRFTSHYTGSTVCAPSRCALTTGRDTGHGTIRGNGAFTLKDDPEDITVARLLKDAGYRTGMIGKSCVTGNVQDPRFVLSKGFDVFYGTTMHKDGHFRYPQFVFDQEKTVLLDGNDRHWGKHYDAEIYTDRAERFIAENPDDQPFFLLLSYPIPHASVLAPDDLAARFDFPDDPGHHPERPHYTPVDHVKANYAGMMVALDGYVGRVMAALREKGVADHTLVCFTSDNGSYSEGGYHYSMLDSNAPLRGGKRDLYEGGIRVPFIAWWPEGIAKPGSEVAQPFAFWDFLPTACQLAGVEAPADIQGISYAPTLTGRGDQAAHDSLYWEFHEMQGRRALRQGSWKLVQYGLEPGAFGEPELYDLSKDIGETENLAAEHPDRVEAMLEFMNAHRTVSKEMPLPGLDAVTGN